MKFQYEIEIEMLKAKLAKAREWIAHYGVHGRCDETVSEFLTELDGTKGTGE